ncbi:MAG: hypothetical protein FJ314_03510 [SAR202 cluster bacterium]|nr:hypothetical protein [SAR202 cluster bacterium]
MAAPDKGGPLFIELRPDRLSVSAVSSLLREVQAALREAARHVPEVAPMFEGEGTPVLLVAFARTADAIGMEFTFTDPTTRQASGAVSGLVARRFMAALESELKRRPQRTLWGQPATTARRKAAEAESDPLSGRASIILAELGRVSSAVIRSGERQIRLSGDTAEII